MREEQAHIKAFRRAKSDFPWFAKTFLRIRNKHGRLVPFILNEAQWNVWNAIKSEWDAGRPAWIILLKARQQGASTLAMALCLWIMVTRGGQQVLTVAHREKAGQDIFRKMQLMYQELPDELKPPEARGNREGDRLGFDQPLGSVAIRESAENIVIGRSGTFQHAHLTELPWWADVRTSMGGLVPTLPKQPGALILIESTAECMGDYFHELWEEASDSDKDSPWRAVFNPWFATSEYQREPTEDDAPLSAVEKEIQAQYSLSVAQMLWRRDTIKAMNNDIERFMKEYPASPEEAFQAAGTPYFDRASLEYYRKRVQIVKPIRSGYLDVDEDGKTEFVDAPGGHWRIYEKPRHGASYIVDADVAGGTARDRSSADIIDAERLVQVAKFLGKMDPDDFAYQLASMGYTYNTALLAVERNGEGRATVLTLYKRIQYPRIFHHLNEDSMRGNESHQVGWVTSPKTRPTMVAQLATLIRSRDIVINDERTVKELSSFVRVDGAKIAEAASGAYDDSVMSLGIGCSSEVRAQALSMAMYEPGDYEPTISTVTGY